MAIRITKTRTFESTGLHNIHELLHMTFRQESLGGCTMQNDQLTTTTKIDPPPAITKSKNGINRGADQPSVVPIHCSFNMILLRLLQLPTVGVYNSCTSRKIVYCMVIDWDTHSHLVVSAIDGVQCSYTVGQCCMVLNSIQLPRLYFRRCNHARRWNQVTMARKRGLPVYSCTISPQVQPTNPWHAFIAAPEGVFDDDTLLEVHTSCLCMSFATIC